MAFPVFLLKPLLRLGYRLAYAALKLYWGVRGGRSRGVTVAIRHGDRLLLVETSYRPGLELPGGGCHRGERAVDAAAREVREELGLEIEPSRFAVLLEHAFVAHGRRFEETILTVDLDEPPCPAPDMIEIIRADMHPIKEIRPSPDKISLTRALSRLQRSEV